MLVLGGEHCNGLFATSRAFVYKPQIFENGAWHTYPENPVPSPRDYHSCAVLLPDGRVFVGGGNNRLYDYEIFSPPYLNNPQFRPTNVTWQAPAPQVDIQLGAYELE